ncbi:acyltransferase [Pedobacter sp. SD-b]|uniref:Acyltransferase n=1 Tax=Pedobacter segetis TaxID=2793069 RepID=A0ABS1BGU0_9SPHI|nr:acyltransferase [Pedobacter segetis]MBK0382060.1 acyltransferase [Pedobacter segetis]
MNKFKLVSRYQILDVLRGVAIILVLFNHHLALGFLQKGGWIGVSLFFILSGYLISGLLFKEIINTGKLDLKLFYIRRGFKIYPNFYFFIFFTVLTLYILFLTTDHLAERLSLKSLLIECFFIQNYFHGFWYHTWSIAVEEHFYLLFPLFLLIFKIKNLTKVKWFYTISSFLILLVLIFRLYHYHTNHSFEIFVNVFSTHFRIDGLIFGIMIGYDEYYNKSKIKAFVLKYIYIFIPLILITIIPAFILNLENPFVFTYGFTLISLGFSILLFYCLEFKEIKFSSFLVRIISYIGTLSYAIYLWQGFILSFVMRFIEESLKIKSTSFPDFFIFASLSILAGWFFTQFLENYFLSIRQKHYPPKKIEIEAE